MPMLRLVPKSELLAVFSKKELANSHMLHNNNHSNKNNNIIMNNNHMDTENNNFTNSVVSLIPNNDIKYSPPSHLYSPQSVSSVNSDCFSSTSPAKPTPTRRRVRRRTATSTDPAEQLTEMSVRGLNLFRYASIDEGVYKCMECAKTDVVKTFKNKYSFQRHAFLYHEGCQRKVFPCPVCGKEFSRPDKMKNHMKTVHDCCMPKECVFPPPPIPFFINPS